MYTVYRVRFITPKGQEKVLVFGTAQGLNQFLRDNREQEWGYTFLGYERHVYDS